jgi:crotonobetainyl-CoA:carnitine CoA-transferase CaiB-like acyl-CoA transferase
VLLSVQNEREWAAFCARVLGQPEIASDPRFADNSARVAHRAELDGLVAEIFAREPRDALVARLEQAAIAYGRVSDLEDLSQHPQNRYVEVETPTGPVRMLAPGALVDGASPEFGPVPACGAHTAAVLREFGG